MIRSDHRYYSHSITEVMAATLDLVAIVTVGCVTAVLHQIVLDVPVVVSLYLGISILVGAAFTTMLSARGLYALEALLNVERQLRAVLLCWTLSFLAMIAIAYLMKAGSSLSRGATVAFFVVGGFGLIGARVVWSVSVRKALAGGRVARRAIALLTWAADTPDTTCRRHLEEGGFRVVEHEIIPEHGQDGMRSGLANLLAKVRGSLVQEIVVALPSKALNDIPFILDQLRHTPLPVRLLPDGQLSSLLFQRKRGFGSFALVEAKREPLTPVERAAKRALDVLFACLGLLLLLPLLAFVVLLIRYDSKGPVIFRQTRRGFNGRTFKIVKLRTMRVVEDGSDIPQATRHDDRVTRVGRWLRRLSVDELPQLWNVIRGDMSIVGPRPHAVAHDDYYDDIIENYAFRQHVKPGLTGWAQVNGSRGETPRVDDMRTRVEFDRWYIGNWSFVLDLRIILLTFTKLFSPSAF